MRSRRLGARSALAGVCALTAFAAAGCLQDPNAGGGPGGVAGGVANNANNDGDGEVQILGNFGGQEAEGFQASLEGFTEETGIEIEYVPDQNFDTTIKQRVNSGQAPDIGIFPQPGGLLELAEQGDVQPIDTFLNVDDLEKTLVPGILDVSRMNGRFYGAPMRMAVKSLVWYPQQAYEQRGYPTEFASIQEMERTMQQIKGDNIAPWCMGWFSDQATGWVGTDWIEEYMLRLHGPDVYDQWVDHDIPFDDPRVVEAFDAFGEMVKGQGNVFGGVRGVLNTPFAESNFPMFRDPPRCVWERQGSFVTGFFPEQVQANLDERVGLFVFPPIEGGFDGQPILGGGDIAASFNGDDEDTQAVMEFLTSDQFGGEWAQAGGWLSPHQTFDPENYADEITRSVAQIAVNADVFRFDASDLMPKEIGSGEFWRAMVNWLQGNLTSQQAAASIEAEWPEAEEEAEGEEAGS